MIEFILNDKKITTQEVSGTTVLDFIRYHQHLTGTKIGCREGDCGACTVLVGRLEEGQLSYQSMTSCLMPLGNTHGKHIVTIEGLNMKELSPVQQAMVDEGGTQCGFCTVGFIVSLSGYTLSQSKPSYRDAIAAIDGNICRCTGYKSIERATENIVIGLKNKDLSDRITWLVERGYLPSYFKTITERLAALNKAISKKISSKEKDAIIVGGGTDLFVQKAEEMPQHTINHLFDEMYLNKIYEKDGKCYIGAACTAEDLRSSSIMNNIFLKMYEYAKLVSSTPIRNMGTIAGNFVNASPIGDLTIFFLALDATIILNNGITKRAIQLKDFYQGYKQLEKQKEEHIEQVYFEIPSKNNTYFNFEKVCKRTHLDIASVNSACLLEIKNGIIIKAHLSAGGIGPIPTYLIESSAFLLGKEVSPDLVRELNQVVQTEISPISDARGTKEYKRLLLRQLVYAHFLTFFPQKLNIHLVLE